MSGLLHKLANSVVILSMVATPLVWAKVTIYLVGDSTMQDWAAGYYPKQGMGQDFGYFFDSGVCSVFNAGRGGTTSLSYYEGFWSVRGKDRNGNYVFDKSIKDMVQSGDYVMIMIGANDNGYKTGEENFKNSVTTMVNDTKAKGANPILISPIRRSAFTNKDSIYESYHAYPVYMRELAASLKVPFIDLDTLSRNYLLSLGEYYSNHYLNMFIDEGEYSTSGAQTDNQHLQQMGANAFGRIVTEQLRFHSDEKTKQLSTYLKPMYQVDVKVSPAGAAKAATASSYYPEGMVVTLKTTPNSGYTFVGWYDGDGNKVSGNLRSEIKSSYMYSFKMGNKSTQYTAVYTGGSAQKYTGTGAAVTKFSVDVPKKLDGLPFNPEGYISGPAEEEKNLGPIEFLSDFEGEDLDGYKEEDGQGWIESNNPGFSGKGFWNFANVLGSTASHKLVFPKAETVVLGIVYANGGNSDRMINAYLDHDYYVSCPPTGSWSTWDTAYAEIMLPQGESTLDFISMTSDGGPNIDHFGFNVKGICRVGQCAAGEDSSETDSSKTDTVPSFVKASLEIPQLGESVVTVFDMHGKLVAKRNMWVGNRISSADLNSMVREKGVYHVVIRKGSQVMRYTTAKVR